MSKRTYIGCAGMNERKRECVRKSFVTRFSINFQLIGQVTSLATDQFPRFNDLTFGRELQMYLEKSNVRAVVVAQLVERSLLIPEVRGLNPVIGKNLNILNICLLSTLY